MELPKMRTINEAYQFIKENDENTAITKNAIRVLCTTNVIRNFKIGKKILLNLDDLIEKISL